MSAKHSQSMSGKMLMRGSESIYRAFLCETLKIQSECNLLV